MEYQRISKRIPPLELMNRMKEIIDSNKESFDHCSIHTANLTSLLPMKNPMSEKNVSWSTQSQKATLVKLSTALLRNNVPVLVVGDNFAMEVYEEIKSSVVKQVNATRVYSYELHPLSTASTIVTDLSSRLAKRGKSTLVPGESREILVAVSDLSVATNQSGDTGDMVAHLVKDLNEPKRLYVDNNGFLVKDLNLLCKLSNKVKTFNERRVLRKFVSLYAEDNFEENVERDMAKLIEKNGEEYTDVVKKIGKASIDLIEQFKPNSFSGEILAPSEIILKILDFLLTREFEESHHLMTEFCLKVHQSLISPLLVCSQQDEMESWVRRTLKQSGIDFQLNYGIELTQDNFPADIKPTVQQFQQCREVIHFLRTEEKLLSLYGKYGYGKTIVLSVAAEYTGYQVGEVRSLQELRAGLLKDSDKAVIMVRDTYIEKDSLAEWLEALMTVDLSHKVVFLMSPRTESLVPWQKWILSRTVVVGIQFWSQDSVAEVATGTQFSADVKTTLSKIHLLVVEYCQNNQLSHQKVSITSCHFFELLSRIEESVEQKINSNKLRVEDLRSIVKSMKVVHEKITTYERDLKQTNQLLSHSKEDIRAIKKSQKLLHEELENLKKEVELEDKVHDNFKEEIEKLKSKHEEIKEKSFDNHEEALANLAKLTPEEKVAFAKPLVVHEDIEKVCTILMILLKMDVFGWKPLKDKFLSDDWVGKLQSVNPDSCKHKQVFIISKKLKEIKTVKAEMRTMSAIGSLIWDFIEGVLKAFTTEFERSKLMAEIQKVQTNLDNSVVKLTSLKEEEMKIKKSIEKQNKLFDDTMKSCTTKENESRKLQEILEHEQNFVKTSSFFLTNCEKQIEEFQIDEAAALQEAIIQETVGTYLGPFHNAQRKELLDSVKSVVEGLCPGGIKHHDFLNNFDLMQIDADLTDNMSNLTSKRILFCMDPNDLVALSLEREGESSKKSIKLYDEADIETIREYLKDEDCSCVLIEDAYFENKKIMNSLLDDNLTEICLAAEQNDKFIFIITKVEEFCLPHKAYSQLYFINLNLSYSEVIRLMMSQFNKHIQKEEDERLTELLNIQEELEEEITDLEEVVVKSVLKRTGTLEDETELLSNLTELEMKTNKMSETKTEIKSILYAINFEKSFLTKCASPIIVSLYLLSKMGLCTKPSFHNFCEATKTLYDDIDNKDDLMFKIYTMFSFQIKEELRTLMAALMSLVYQVMQNEIAEECIENFLKLSKDLSSEEQEAAGESFEDKPEWLPARSWVLLQRYELSTVFLLNGEFWKKWTAQSRDEMEGEDHYNVLMICLILDHQRFNSHLVRYVEKVLGWKYLRSETIIVAEVHSYSSPNDPIVFLLGSSVEEPSSDLTKLADLQGIASSKVKYLALSETNICLAMDLLETAFIRGQWLIFQNVDLVPYFLPILDKKIQEKDADDVHEDFRVWMTWTDSQLPTFSLLQRAVILSCEQSRDIRYHNSNFLYNIPLKIVRQQQFFQSVLFFTFCYLQKVFACRQKFSGLAWANSPEMPNYLMQSAYQFFSQYFNITQDSVRKIQFKQLLSWTKEFLYFNHMTNPVDREVISMYLDEYIGQFLFEQHNPFKSSFVTRDALEEVITGKIEELKNLPGITADMIMLSPASNGLYQMKTSAKTSAHITNYFEDQPRLKLVAITAQLDRLVRSLEQCGDYEEFPGRSLVRWEVVRFEIDHVRSVARDILQQVESLYQCLLEGRWPSASTLEIINQMLRGQTPQQWR